MTIMFRILRAGGHMFVAHMSKTCVRYMARNHQKSHANARAYQLSGPPCYFIWGSTDRHLNFVSYLLFCTPDFAMWVVLILVFLAYNMLIYVIIVISTFACISLCVCISLCTYVYIYIHTHVCTNVHVNLTYIDSMSTRGGFTDICVCHVMQCSVV